VGRADAWQVRLREARVFWRQSPALVTCRTTLLIYRFETKQQGPLCYASGHLRWTGFISSSFAVKEELIDQLHEDVHL
jgi:hypothetical protein